MEILVISFLLGFFGPLYFEEKIQLNSRLYFIFWIIVFSIGLMALDYTSSNYYFFFKGVAALVSPLPWGFNVSISLILALCTLRCDSNRELKYLGAIYLMMIALFIYPNESIQLLLYTLVALLSQGFLVRNFLQRNFLVAYDLIFFFLVLSFNSNGPMLDVILIMGPVIKILMKYVSDSSGYYDKKWSRFFDFTNYMIWTYLLVSRFSFELREEPTIVLATIICVSLLIIIVWMKFEKNILYHLEKVYFLFLLYSFVINKGEIALYLLILISMSVFVSLLFSENNFIEKFVLSICLLPLTLNLPGLPFFFIAQRFMEVDNLLISKFSSFLTVLIFPMFSMLSAYVVLKNSEVVNLKFDWTSNVANKIFISILLISVIVLSTVTNNASVFNFVSSTVFGQDFKADTSGYAFSMSVIFSVVFNLGILFFLINAIKFSGGRSFIQFVEYKILNKRTYLSVFFFYKNVTLFSSEFLKISMYLFNLLLIRIPWFFIDVFQKQLRIIGNLLINYENKDPRFDLLGIIILFLIIFNYLESSS